MTNTEFPRVIPRSIGKPVEKQGFGVIEMEVPCRWFPGDTLSWDDALFINYALAYYAGSNFVARMKKLQTEGKTEAEIKEIFADYVAKYSWSPADRFDPIETEARRMAKEILSNSGVKLSDLSDEEVEAKIARVFEVVPTLRLDAERVINARQGAKVLLSPEDLA